MSLYETTVPQFIKMLQNVERWLGKAEAHAKAKKFEVDTLLQARLAPDQYPLVRQIQSACDGAKFGAARLSGKEAPRNPDTEQTWAEIQKRIAGTIEFLQSCKSEDFEGADKRLIALPFLEGKLLLGSDYLAEMVLPNMYFHLTTAYAILRHNGVDLGKMDYLGSLKLRDA